MKPAALTQHWSGELAIVSPWWTSISFDQPLLHSLGPRPIDSVLYWLIHQNFSPDHRLSSTKCEPTLVITCPVDGWSSAALTTVQSCVSVTYTHAYRAWQCSYVFGLHVVDVRCTCRWPTIAVVVVSVCSNESEPSNVTWILMAAAFTAILFVWRNELIWWRTWDW